MSDVSGTTVKRDQAQRNDRQRDAQADGLGADHNRKGESAPHAGAPIPAPHDHRRTATRRPRRKPFVL